ncbi:MAG: DUF421 domain-containing protein [Acidimicrobiia bacterium]|nr:DUF421 domain-containing protein [Acidimicrobiia bacterium]
MSWLTGNWTQLGQVAAKAALMYVTALVALRLGERRTLAQWTIIDFATAVAMGAIIGRTAIAQQSYVTGAVAVVTLVAIHRAASILRFNGLVGKLFDHRVRVLVADGQMRRHQLRRCGLTDNDLYTQLRQRGVFTLGEVQYVLYETKGSITIVPKDGRNDELVEQGLADAVGYP